MSLVKKPVKTKSAAIGSRVIKQRSGKLRDAMIERNTTETQIRAHLTIEGKGRYQISTGIRFFDHMLELFARHGGFDLDLQATGDLDIDQHHTVEDVGIVLGECVREALGDKRGINRAGYFIMPLDEALAVAAVDLSGRPYLGFNAKFRQRIVGDLQTELVEDFFGGFANQARANVHLKLLGARSTHHAVEAIFKTFARALKMAASMDARLKSEMPSTKGLL
ncbi:MAG: imidazoleglycerol-phosphate dehydratase HisB [Acidobacteria bacterium]|nr:imidazoleglycerol-phosphate dehydratase HisB [Acidobacteriota bacterium]